MPVSLFTDGLEPDNQEATIWRFMELWKFRNLIETGTLHFRRADLFPDDETEGLPPEDYIHVLGLNPLDIKDRREIDHHLGSIAQFRQGFYINCWYLGDDDTAQMWQRLGHDGVAITSRYSLLKSALAELSGEAHLGLIRYGSAHLTGWNIMRFVTTKRLQYADEREVRALLWIRDERDGMNRHFDENNIPHPRPVMEPPNAQEAAVRRVDVQKLVTSVIMSPWAADTLRSNVEQVLHEGGYSIPIEASALTRFKDFLPYVVHPMVRR